MKAIILAGGLGTRLRTVVSDLPKPMAPIGNRPFLAYLFDYLENQGVNKVILSTGYKHEVIENYFGNQYQRISILYSREEEPLGTGGAIKKAFEKVEDENVFILNGDTFFAVNLMEMKSNHLNSQVDLTIALKPLENFDRYGVVLTAGNRITAFKEKGYQKIGNINGGIYLANQSLFEGLTLPAKFSFEKDVLEEQVNYKQFSSYVTDSYFIDIGIPQDYEKAQKELLQHI